MPHNQFLGGLTIGFIVVYLCDIFRRGVTYTYAVSHCISHTRGRVLRPLYAIILNSSTFVLLLAGRTYNLHVICGINAGNSALPPLSPRHGGSSHSEEYR